MNPLDRISHKVHEIIDQLIATINQETSEKISELLKGEVNSLFEDIIQKQAAFEESFKEVVITRIHEMKQGMKTSKKYRKHLQRLQAERDSIAEAIAELNSVSFSMGFRGD